MCRNRNQGNNVRQYYLFNDEIKVLLASLSVIVLSNNDAVLVFEGDEKKKNECEMKNEKEEKLEGQNERGSKEQRKDGASVGTCTCM